MPSSKNSFAEQVYQKTKQVPQGRVTTYKAIAEALGTKAYRAVGQALHCNPYAPLVPCHRVVASNGHLHGFASGLPQKKKLLEKEGVVIQKNVINLDTYFFRVR